MNIYGHLNKANQILLELVDQESNFTPQIVIDQLRGTWIYVEKYIKNTHSNWSSHWSHRLKTLTSQELAISEDMIKDTYRKVDQIVKERKVKDYFNLYISVVEGLTTYSKSYEESCDVCQGELRYFTDTKSGAVVKKCCTCGCLFNGKSGEKLSVSKEFQLRVSTKSELVKNGVIQYP